jgi:hypothetical protein
MGSVKGVVATLPFSKTSFSENAKNGHMTNHFWILFRFGLT